MLHTKLRETIFSITKNKTIQKKIILKVIIFTSNDEQETVGGVKGQHIRLGELPSDNFSWITNDLQKQIEKKLNFKIDFFEKKNK